MVLWNIVLLDGWSCGTLYYSTDGLAIVRSLKEVQTDNHIMAT